MPRLSHHRRNVLIGTDNELAGTDNATWKPGAEITLTRTYGATAVFQVSRVSTLPKDAFPTNTVYGNLDYPGLRFITRGGSFGHTTTSTTSSPSPTHRNPNQPDPEPHTPHQQLPRSRLLWSGLWI